MKTRQQLHVGRNVGVANQTPSYHIGGSPNSSATFAMTVLASPEDVLAVIRTAALLGKGLKSAVCVNLPGDDVIQIESGEGLTEAALLKTLDSIQNKLCKQDASQAPVFALEASITAASFLAAGAIAVHIHSTDSQTPMVAR